MSSPLLPWAEASQNLAALCFYGTIVVLKLMLMAPLTTRARVWKQVFANPEDATWFGKFLQKATVKFGDEMVERVRRCHLNDLENIVPFILLGLFYCFVAPSHALVLWNFRIFTVSRIVHTIVYLNQVPQPARGTAFFTGVGVCLSMALQTLYKLGLAYL